MLRAKEEYQNLKSNMDRFIVCGLFMTAFQPDYLKSNMDRFIVFLVTANRTSFQHLKSNMDRFIGRRYQLHMFCKCI